MWVHGFLKFVCKKRAAPCGWAALVILTLRLARFGLPNRKLVLKDYTQENNQNNANKGEAVNVFHNSLDNKV